MDCRTCGSEMDWEVCDVCGGEGFDGHDCGEDTCSCLHPEYNITCNTCQGDGGWWICLNCVNQGMKT